MISNFTRSWQQKIHTIAKFSDCCIFFELIVGGVMAFLTLHEMLPTAFDNAGHKQAIQALFLGMAFMSGRLLLIQMLCRFTLELNISFLHADNSLNT
ncbi:hypothetical protein ZIOFF_001459 [Zingiber officinale]|uniref:Uncharacterized protein n=1 Tax=Zingiber officinale TaxID=94328 RepID=A0A8J5IJU3_ZINOF|nr:hypothetical protein ZIOFF_001459 [Zingiber officinale]